MIATINYLEILKAIRICAQKPRYKVGIFAVTLKDLENNYINVIEEIRLGDEESKSVAVHSKYGSGSIIIEFDNGSTIHFVRASNYSRGYRFNYVIYDERIDKEILDTVVRVTEFRYMEEPDGR